MNQQSRWQTHGRYPFLLAKYVGMALVGGVILALLYRLRVVAIPVLFAAFLAFVLHRPVDWMAKRIPRPLAAALLVFVSVLALAALSFLILPTLFAQVAELMHRLPEMLETADRSLSPWFEANLGIALHLDRAAISNAIAQHAGDLAAPSGWVLSRIFSSAVTLGLAALNVVIVVVFAYYIVVDHQKIDARVMDLVPPRYRRHVRSAFDAVDEALSRYVLGQSVVCCVLATVYAIALTVIGVKGGAIIGVIAGLVGFVPYLGILTGLGLSLLSIGLDYAGVGQLVAVLATFAVVPVLDTAIVTPNIIGNRVGLNPFLVIVALLVGAELMGFLGVLLAVPTAAVLRALLSIGLEGYHHTRFYLGESEPPTDLPANP